MCSPPPWLREEGDGEGPSRGGGWKSTASGGSETCRWLVDVMGKRAKLDDDSDDDLLALLKDSPPPPPPPPRPPPPPPSIGDVLMELGIASASQRIAGQGMWDRLCASYNRQDGSVIPPGSGRIERSRSPSTSGSSSSPSGSRSRSPSLWGESLSLRL
jgi:hypothetical protein